jgi:hypothetical protein
MNWTTSQRRSNEMKLKTKAWLAAALLMGVLIPTAAGQEPPVPGSISLLPGYHHRAGQGIDSQTGVIWKKGALTIHYDIGELAGNYAECGHLCGWTDGEVWRREQVLQGQKVICVFTSKKRLVVSFPESHANFYATVQTDEELTDMLLMLLTFRSLRADKSGEGAEKMNGYDTIRYSIDTARGDAPEQALYRMTMGPGGFEKGMAWVTEKGCPVKLSLDAELHGANGSVDKIHYEEAMVRK